jgi:hypothetical protein
VELEPPPDELAPESVPELVPELLPELLPPLPELLPDAPPELLLPEPPLDSPELLPEPPPELPPEAPLDDPPPDPPLLPSPGAPEPDGEEPHALVANGTAASKPTTKQARRCIEQSPRADTRVSSPGSAVVVDSCWAAIKSLGPSFLSVAARRVAPTIRALRVLLGARSTSRCRIQGPGKYPLAEA